MDPEFPDSEAQEEPLSERFPRYVAVFASGLGVAAIGGIVWGGFTRVSFADGIAYAIMLYGTTLLLVGGAQGGGYANMGVGAAGSLFGSRYQHDEDLDDADIRRRHQKKRDPMERLRRGLRPEANPTAFWQVIGGFGYIAIGLLFLEALA